MNLLQCRTWCEKMSTDSEGHYSKGILPFVWRHNSFKMLQVDLLCVLWRKACKGLVCFEILSEGQVCCFLLTFALCWAAFRLQSWDLICWNVFPCFMIVSLTLLVAFLLYFLSYFCFKKENDSKVQAPLIKSIFLHFAEMGQSFKL